MQTTDADQPAQSHSLLSKFEIHFLDSIVPIVAPGKNSKSLASFCSLAGQFVLPGRTNPEDMFSHDVAHISLACNIWSKV